MSLEVMLVFVKGVQSDIRPRSGVGPCVTPRGGCEAYLIRCSNVTRDYIHVRSESTFSISAYGP